MESKPDERLDDRADGLGDVGLFGDERDKRVGHGSGAEPDDRRTWRTNHDIGANAASALRRAIEGAITHAHEGEDHRNFDGNGQYAEGCAHRAVAEIGDDELVDQFAIDRRVKIGKQVRVTLAQMNTGQS